MKLPDVGEGVAEAEIVEWHVEVGDPVTTETVLAEVLTDKATVEVSSPVSGTVIERFGEPGETVAVGAWFVVIDTGGEPASAPDVATATEATPTAQTAAGPEPSRVADVEPVPDATPSARPGKALAAPSVRARAQSLGVDLAAVAGTGPGGLVTHADLDRELVAGRVSHPPQQMWGAPAEGRGGGARIVPVRGVRRQIAHRMSEAWAQIPHITYVDGVDVTEVERLRTELNRGLSDGSTRLTLLPLLVRAVLIAVREQPELNAHYDHEAETLTVFDAVHVGIATQTDAGLRVPVVRDVQDRALHDLAAEIGRLAATARAGTATRDELSGSTITVTSLGALGGLMTTPIINAPEVAVVGVNAIEVRPLWVNGAFAPRQVMNLSCSFDHRMVDGWDAAVFVQRIKTLVEMPALLLADRRELSVTRDPVEP